jgi:8-oxo-dGTP diphosphatase
MSDPVAESPRFPRPALTVDLVIFAGEMPREVLLIRRRQPPFANWWALPGGFVEENEPLEATARRELKEETGIDVADFIQIGAFGDPGRDPRGWTVTVAYLAWVDRQQMTLLAGDDAADAQWHSLADLPPLAFDHAMIIQQALVKFSEQHKNSNVGLPNP